MVVLCVLSNVVIWNLVHIWRIRNCSFMPNIMSSLNSSHYSRGGTWSCVLNACMVIITAIMKRCLILCWQSSGQAEISYVRRSSIHEYFVTIFDSYISNGSPQPYAKFYTDSNGINMEKLWKRKNISLQKAMSCLRCQCIMYTTITCVLLNRSARVNLRFYLAQMKLSLFFRH